MAACSGNPGRGWITIDTRRRFADPRERTLGSKSGISTKFTAILLAAVVVGTACGSDKPDNEAEATGETQETAYEGMARKVTIAYRNNVFSGRITAKKSKGSQAEPETCIADHEVSLWKGSKPYKGKPLMTTMTNKKGRWSIAGPGTMHAQPGTQPGKYWATLLNVSTSSNGLQVKCHAWEASVVVNNP
jgi:hypothetical protein